MLLNSFKNGLNCVFWVEFRGIIKKFRLINLLSLIINDLNKSKKKGGLKNPPY
jgi:hypothetical protein